MEEMNPCKQIRGKKCFSEIMTVYNRDTGIKSLKGDISMTWVSFWVVDKILENYEVDNS